MNNSESQDQLIVYFGSVVLGICWSEAIGGFLEDGKYDMTSILMLASLLLYSIRLPHSYLIVASYNQCLKKSFLPKLPFFRSIDFVLKLILLFSLSVMSFYWLPGHISMRTFLICFWAITMCGVMWDFLIIKFHKEEYCLHDLQITIETWFIFDIATAMWLAVGLINDFSGQLTKLSLLPETIFGFICVLGVADYLLNWETFFYRVEQVNCSE